MSKWEPGLQPGGLGGPCQTLGCGGEARCRQSSRLSQAVQVGVGEERWGSALLLLLCDLCTCIVCPLPPPETNLKLLLPFCSLGLLLFTTSCVSPGPRYASGAFESVIHAVKAVLRGCCGMSHVLDAAAAGPGFVIQARPDPSKADFLFYPRPIITDDGLLCRLARQNPLNCCIIPL